MKPKYVTHDELKEAINNAPFVTHGALKVILKQELAPFVTREELKIELAKKPAWFDAAITEALAPIIKRLDQNGLKQLVQ